MELITSPILNQPKNFKILVTIQKSGLNTL